MLTHQAYRGYARPAEAEYRRVYRHLSFAFGPGLSKEETSSDGKGRHSRQVRLRQA